MKSVASLLLICLIGYACSGSKFGQYEKAYKDAFMCQCMGHYYPDTVSIREGDLCMSELRTLIGDGSFVPGYYPLIDSVNRVMRLDVVRSCDYEYEVYPYYYCVIGYCFEAYKSRPLSKQAQLFAKKCRQINRRK